MASPYPGCYLLTDYGAVGDGVTDCSPAWDALLAEVHALPVPPGALDPRWMGAEVVIPRGVYYHSRRVELDRTLFVRGVGGGWYAGSQLRFAPGVGGFLVHRWNTSPSPSPGPGDWSVIADLAVTSAGGKAGPGPAHGVQLYARARVTNVAVRGFSGNGVHIDTSNQASPQPGLNADNWELTQLRIDNCGGHGVYTFGVDSSAGVGTLLDVAACGGWGVWDHGFLGNTWVQCEVAGCPTGGYCSDSPTGASTFLNCYAEGDCGPNKLGNSTLWMGGVVGNPTAPWTADSTGTAMRPQTDGLHMDVAGLVNLMRTRDGKTLYGYSGLPGGSPGVQAFGTTDDDKQEFSLRYGVGDKGTWYWLWQNARRLMAWHNKTAANPGRVGFPSGYQLGEGSVRGCLHWSDTGPPTVGGPFKVGDAVHNCQPAAGGWAGWVCVQGGSPGSWKPYGRVDT
jgi:hypothetical protein